MFKNIITCVIALTFSLCGFAADNVPAAPKAGTVAPTTPTTPKPLPKTKINPKDGAEMVLIPAGEFLMGTSEEELTAWLKDHPADTRKLFSDQLPQHKVYLDAYYLYKTEVTVAQYRKFCAATAREMPKEPEGGWHDNHPMVKVSWEDAKAYADWAGVVLPSEAQWEKAARGGDGRLYPWGNTWPPPAKAGNFYDETANKQLGSIEGLVGYVDGYTYTAPVGSFTPNPFGLYDMAGNVWEWCEDWYDFGYYNIAPANNPTGPTAGIARVKRGGSCGFYLPRHLLTTHRYPQYPNFSNPGIGFRCAVKILNPVVPINPPKAPLPVTKKNNKDDAEMVLIPAGEFLMGTSEDEIPVWKKAHPSDQYFDDSFTDQMPQHNVRLDSYYMYKTEVTVAQYRKFCKETGRQMPLEPEMPPDPEWKYQDHHPIVNVTWEDANSYAKWAGASLPTEAEWEKAARGDNRVFPWGNDWPPPEKAGNLADATTMGKIMQLQFLAGFRTGLGRYNDGFAYLSPVGSFAANPFGLYDMAGNVYEWCSDWYSKEYYKNAPMRNPSGPEAGTKRVTRGGSWFSGFADAYRCADRSSYIPTKHTETIGFRCVVRSVVP
jgi:sulfatase modifying factor 1